MHSPKFLFNNHGSCGNSQKLYNNLHALETWQNLNLKMQLIRENLERLEDVKLILLKGHLVIEQLITELLELSLKEPERLKSINLMLAKKA